MFRELIRNWIVGVYGCQVIVGEGWEVVQQETVHLRTRVEIPRCENRPFICVVAVTLLECCLTDGMACLPEDRRHIDKLALGE